MHYDASPKLHHQLTGQIRKDIRVLRWKSFKLAERLDQIVHEGGLVSMEALRPSELAKNAEWRHNATAKLSEPLNVFESLKE